MAQYDNQSASAEVSLYGKNVNAGDTPVSVDASGRINTNVATALPTGANTIGNVGITGALPAGSNSIGTVGVTSLPALSTGANTIGNVGITTAIPAGSNNIGSANIATMAKGTTTVGSPTSANVDANTQALHVGVALALPTGTNVIGTVNQQALFGTVLNIASTPITVTTTSADLTVGVYRELAIDVNISAITGTTPSYILSVNRKGADGVYYPIYTGTSQTMAGKVSISLGIGASTNTAFGNIIQVVETIAGTSPSITRSISIVGK